MKEMKNVFFSEQKTQGKDSYCAAFYISFILKNSQKDSNLLYYIYISKNIDIEINITW